MPKFNVNDKLSEASSSLGKAINATSPIVDSNGNIVPNFGTSLNNDFQKNGFVVSSPPTADAAGLPYSKVPHGLIAPDSAVNVRRVIHWYIPEYGIIKMYINPNRIIINDKKIVNPTRTKGGYTLQYWGEELTTLDITGTTGSSGIEGINVLHELYRAEQYGFDGVGLSLAASNISSGGKAIANSVAGAIGGTTGNIVGGALSNAVNSAAGQFDLYSQNIPSLAQIAFGIEMFYLGWVYRGYFTSFSVTESAENLGLYDYTLNFTATQRRGYRTNQFPWQRTPNISPSDSSNDDLLTYGILNDQEYNSRSR